MPAPAESWPCMPRDHTSCTNTKLDAVISLHEFGRHRPQRGVRGGSRRRGRRSTNGSRSATFTPNCNPSHREKGRTLMVTWPQGEIDEGRREVLKFAAAGSVAAALGTEVAAQSRPATTAPSFAGAYNILFILTDQERYFRPGELPREYRLPGHARLAQRGIVFENHRINSCVCTSSRSVLYTGRHIQHTRMFDNTNFPWISSLSTDIRTVGHLLREAGYHTAYKGKWHLTKEFETVNSLGTPEKIFTREMDAYGFGDYFGVGDIIAHTRGGYLHDGIISAMGVNWLRGRGKELAAQGKPWFLAVNLVNPHDIMFVNTDRPGEKVQARNILGHIEPVPDDPLYAKQWPFELPRSHGQRLDAPGRPP